MTLTTVATLIGLAGAAAVAWALGGIVGTGVLAGALLAASVTVFGLAWQRHLMRTAPKRALNAVAVGFLAKLGALGLGVACIRLLEPVAERADGQAFVLGFVAVSVAILIPGTLGNVRAHGARAHAAPGQPAPAAGKRPASAAAELTGGRSL